ncbi:chemotaxis protein CheW [uncultured Rubinisphaera sp.]|uniref:chemotaxis protein CheW n=1 Tax=uncultured Rubinisphaera sp. TaxID=1678686 RepID=UPI0030DC16BC|tara:strand:- start:1174 stop:1644 length:471 start_codon:yes stop_codon:yes gene_type:complete
MHHDSATGSHPKSESIQLVTFRVEDSWMGVNIDHVQELNRHIESTRVPAVDSYVSGVVHLRGEVVTLIDLRILLGYSPAESTESQKAIVIDLGDERIGMLVDHVDDVCTFSCDQIEDYPSHLHQSNYDYFESIINTDHKVISVLNIANVLSVSLTH